ncbi:MAG: hypothetical protein R3243_14785 [Arenibacter latericius]|nr:hypothetical protein [Arenibacter latericius]
MENKIYINDKGSLVVDYNGVRKTHRPTGTAYAIYNSNDGKFSISNGIQDPVLATDFQDENGDAYVSLDALRGAIDDFFARPSLQQAGIDLDGVGTLTIADADTWVELNPVGANFQISANAKGFYRDILESEVVFDGLTKTNAIFSGSTDLKCSANTTIKFALVKSDDVLNPIAVSEHTFDAANKVENFSINKNIELNYDDRLNLYAQSASAGTVLTIYSLNTSYVCDR